MFKTLLIVFVFYFFVWPSLRRLTGLDAPAQPEQMSEEDRLLAVCTILGMRMGAVDGSFDPSEVQALLRSLYQFAYGGKTQRWVEVIVKDVMKGGYSQLSEQEVFAKFSVDANGRNADAILNVLADVARADGVIGDIEVRYFVHVASMLGIAESDAVTRLKSGAQGSRSNGGGQRSRSRPASSAGGDDPYEVLGLKPGASQDEIKKRYRELAKQLHPDKVAHVGGEIEKLVSDRFVKVQQAYEALTR